MNPDILAGLLKNFYDSFNMNSFSNRLKLQKMIYLMQAHGLNIGYSYGLYLYGPYSKELARDGFAMPDIKTVPKVVFEKPEDAANFKKFKALIDSKKNDDTWLEIASSIHILKKLEKSDSEVINMIKNKHGDLFKDKETEIKEILIELKKQGCVV